MVISGKYGNHGTTLFFRDVARNVSTTKRARKVAAHASCSVTQGFLYAPFGEIIDEYTGIAPTSALPKYSFNAKELDEETGMYYYEARYYKPPVFTSRDPMFEKYFWMSPYAYCANNPMKYVDPTGREMKIPPLLTLTMRHPTQNPGQSMV